MSAEENVSTQSEDSQLIDASEAWLNEHFKFIRRKILNRACELQEQDIERSLSDRSLEVKYVSLAAMEYAPGDPFARVVTFKERIYSSISGITVISALLVAFFGILGVVALMGFQGIKTENAAGFFDVVKIFAGAIVGSTGATAGAAVLNGSGKR